MGKLSGILAAVLAVVFVFGMVGAREAAAAPTLLGTTGTVEEEPGISTLVQLDPTTGALVRTIGSVGFMVNGLAYEATSGKLYGSTSVNDPVYNGLIEIDLATGAGTAVGVNGWGLLGTTAVTNITLDSTGQMFGWWDPNEDDLVSIDKTTGVATRVGESGVGTAENGLAFDSSDVLYMVNSGGDYYTVDTGTGAANYENTIDSMAHHGVFDFSSGIYYGISSTSDPRSLVLADLSTGSIISTFPTVDGLHTLAFVVVPEPAALGLMGAGLLGLARRKRG